jgi:hypothetical protein
MTWDALHTILWCVLSLPVLFVGYLFVALYIYAPLKIKGKEGKPLDITFDRIELPQLPPEVSAAFYSACRDLAAGGFTALGTLRRHVPATRQDSFVSIWINPRANDSAQIIGVCTPSAAGRRRVVTLTVFHTEFSDETSIVTSNSPSPSCFPRDRQTSAVRCPGIYDCGQLYRFHQARVNRDRRGRVANLRRVSDALERMRWEHAATYERLIEAGYYTLDATAQRYQPTLKGAYLMTYKLLPPFKQIQKARKDRLADRTLRDLGFGGLDAFRQAQQAAR